MENKNKNNKKEINRNIFRNAKFLIDQNIYKFLLALIQVIFIKKNKTTRANKAIQILNDLIQKVNKEIIGEEKKLDHLSLDYNHQNFINIINFVKTQNSRFYSEILENILIIIFSMAFKNEKENIFGRYIYNNIEQLKKIKNDILAEWFDQQKFNSQVLEMVKDRRESYIRILLEFDPSDNTNIESYNIVQKDIILFSILKEIYDGKYLGPKLKKISLDNSFSSEEDIIIFDYIPPKFSNLDYNDDIDSMNRIPIKLTRSLLIIVYIYCQIKQSHLMKYIKESDNNKELEVLPFVYDLYESDIESENFNIIFAPVRIEPRIEKIKMNEIFMREKSYIEFSKALLFNQNIKTIDFSLTIMKSYYIDIMQEFQCFNNNSVEELDLSFNYLKEDSRKH